MNNEHWLSHRYVVRDHEAGSGTFSYDTDYNSFCEKYGGDTKNNKYFLDGCMAAFDYPGEWALDDEGHINLRLPAEAAAEMGTDVGSGELSDTIGSLTVYGKVQSYAAFFNHCNFLKVDNITFFGTGLLM